MVKKIFSLFLLGFFCFGILPVCADEEENLVKGLSYKVETGEPISKSYGNYSEGDTEFDEDNGQLTDNKTASASMSADGWYRAFRGKSRLVTFDLGDTCAVSRVEAGFLHAGSGLYAPRYINVYLSDDGDNYATVIKYDTEIPLHETETKRYDIRVELDKTYSARYVKIEFCCDIFAYCDEIRVFGSRSLSGNETKIIPDKPESDRGYFEALDGVSDIIKLYNGYYAPNPDTPLLTEERVLPYVAYLDTNGEIAGRMFDAIALVPCHGDYPSGGRLTKTSGKPAAVMSDWELYYDITFKEDQDLDAIEKTVEKVYSTLGINEKYKVYLTLPYPTVTDKPFGDIDGDGEDEYCQTLEERIAIIKWYIDKYIEGFAAKGYESIELAGFYWYREEVNYSDSDHEDELVKAMNDYADSKKLKTIFDAFYLSIGYDHWEELGFDSAVMQPNLAFRSARPYYLDGMLDEFAISASKNYIGVEMETDEPSYFRGDEYLEAGFNYESYLYYGYKTGYMHSLKTYYQGAGPGSIYDFCHADISTPKGIYLRRLYDLTYQFIHETYKNDPPVLAVQDKIELVSGEKAVSEITITDPDSYWGDIKVEFPQQAARGVVKADANKRSLVYRADRGYVGEDSFTVRVTDGFNYSEEFTVNVTVSALDEDSEESSTVSNDVSDDNEKGSVPPWLIALLSVLGVAVVAVAAVMLFKLKK